MRIPLLTGKFCAEANWQTAVVNRSFANAYLNGSSPIGHHIQLAQPMTGQSAQAIVGYGRRRT